MPIIWVVKLFMWGMLFHGGTRIFSLDQNLLCISKVGGGYHNFFCICQRGDHNCFAYVKGGQVKLATGDHKQMAHPPCKNDSSLITSTNRVSGTSINSDMWIGTLTNWANLTILKELWGRPGLEVRFMHYSSKRTSSDTVTDWNYSAFTDFTKCIFFANISWSVNKSF